MLKALKTVPMTVMLLAAIVAVYLGYRPRLVPGEEVWQLIAWGANVPALSLHGQPWRWLTSLFLHGGPYHMHLLFNGYALWLLGRTTERMFGSDRFIVIYFVSGISGSVASALFGTGLLSIGASGAIFGLAGAMIAGLSAVRGRVPESWRKAAMKNLFIVVGLQIVIGFSVPMIDNAAHIGGVIGGLLVGALLGPRMVVSVRGFRGYQARWLAPLCLTLVVVSGVSAFREAPGDFLSHMPTKLFELSENPSKDTAINNSGRVELHAPVHWERLANPIGLALQDPLLAPTPTFQVLPVERISIGVPANATGENAQLMELAYVRDQLIMDKLGEISGLRSLEMKTLQPIVLRNDLVRSEVYLLVGEHAITQYHYYKKIEGQLQMMWARVPLDKRALYTPILDRVAATVASNGFLQKNKEKALTGKQVALKF